MSLINVYTRLMHHHIFRFRLNERKKLLYYTRLNPATVYNTVKMNNDIPLLYKILFIPGTSGARICTLFTENHCYPEHNVTKQKEFKKKNKIKKVK